MAWYSFHMDIVYGPWSMRYCMSQGLIVFRIKSVQIPPNIRSYLIGVGYSRVWLPSRKFLHSMTYSINHFLRPRDTVCHYSMSYSYVFTNRLWKEFVTSTKIPSSKMVESLSWPRFNFGSFEVRIDHGRTLNYNHISALKSGFFTIAINWIH